MSKKQLSEPQYVVGGSCKVKVSKYCIFIVLRDSCHVKNVVVLLIQSNTRCQAVRDINKPGHTFAAVRHAALAYL